MTPRDFRQRVGRRSGGNMCRTRTAATAMTLLLVSACGSQESSTSSVVELEPATSAGLTAAVLTHLDAASVKRSNANGNESEGWKAVELEVKAEGVVVPLSVMVMEYTEETGRPSTAEMCARGNPGMLSCRTGTRSDGSKMWFMASSEDLTGGIVDHGLVAYVGHLRQDHVVLVMETSAPARVSRSPRCGAVDTSSRLRRGRGRPRWRGERSPFLTLGASRTSPLCWLGGGALSRDSYRSRTA